MKIGPPSDNEKKACCIASFQICKQRYVWSMYMYAYRIFDIEFRRNDALHAWRL